MELTAEQSTALDQLARTFGAKAASGQVPLTDTGRPATVRVGTRDAGIGYAQPWGLTRSRVAGKAFYTVHWEPAGTRQHITGKRDADLLIDLHRYAAGYRRITGELPAWASE